MSSPFSPRPWGAARLRWAGLLAALLAPSLVLAQSSGTIAGTVVDGDFGGGLPGATVFVEELATGAAADIDGNYLISRVPAGTYTVRFSYTGYGTQTVQNVAVADGEAARINVTLIPGAELGEIVVEAKEIIATNSEAGLLRVRARATQVSDAISAEAISRSGSDNAADALEKVTGASVVGGRYVYVRGLGDRYVNTQLNGSVLPSADPDRNAVPLDLFPSDLIENIVTTKTFTPDQPGSFSGGTVNINTKSFPPGLVFTLSSSVGYNAAVTGQSGFLRSNTGSRDWLGVDDGTRDVPGAWQRPGTQSPNATLARFDPASAGELHVLSTAFNPVLAPMAGEAPANRSFALSLGNRVELFGQPLGMLAGLSYSRDFSGYAGGTTAQWQLTGSVAQTDSLTNNLRLADTQGAEETLLGGLLTLSYQPHPNHEVGTSVVYNRNGISEARYQNGTYYKNFNTYNERFFETRTLSYNERSLFSGQLRGEHAFPHLGGLRAEWSSALTRTAQNEPDLRFFANDYTLRFDGDGQPVDTLYAITFSNYGKPSRYYRDLNDQNWASDLRLSLPFGGPAPGTLTVGGAAALSDRTFSERRFEYTTNASVYRYDGDPTAFFERGTGIVDTTATGQFRIGNVLYDATNPGNSYEGDQAIYGAFAMAEVRPLPRLRAIAGARLESTRLETFNADTTGSIREMDVLPSLNLVYEVRDNMNVRAAYGRTLARPTFRELSPFVSFDFVGDYIFIGNPGLERTLIDNADLRWEWFTRPGEILAVSGFYKRFQDPIERAIVSNNNQVQFQNVDQAEVFGAEFEARRRFGALPLVSGAIEVGGNLTLARSRVRIPAGELAVIRDLDPDAPATRDFQGQSPFVGNLDAAYLNERTGTTLSALYNVFGRRLANVSLGGSPNDYEFATGTLDLTLRQSLRLGLSLSASAKNVLGEDARFGQTYNGQEYVTREYVRPRTFSVGVSYRLD